MFILEVWEFIELLHWYHQRFLHQLRLYMRPLKSNIDANALYCLVLIWKTIQYVFRHGKQSTTNHNQQKHLLLNNG